MNWQPTIPVRERILVMGGPGAGKSTAWLSMARKLPTSHFYAIDSDAESINRLLHTEYTDVRDNGNVTVFNVTGWQDWVEALQFSAKNSGPDDWLVPDMIGPAWDLAQEHYTDRVFGQSLDTYFLEARMASKKGNAFDGRKDWPVIKGLYRSCVSNPILNFPGHKFLTAGVKAIADDADKAVKDIFGSVGVMPVAEKTIGHAMHSILFIKKKRPGQWTVSTVKDRGRAEMEEVPVTDFFKDYLVGVAKWRPAA